ncbi:AMP-dependent synthetase and ligase [Candidatus Sulfotelmatobacter kueseliae]|uniref:AMP-dependent synthetase and ligase n=1 Tax=Candidatus Sulfotelmatobacter kueseliae TaxID=2042962 RepID=A0A2U3KII6_9BACT|nr:AMP-dependent synthetase and ligase [Candidatus Sulfotelmatobacter kueseliae]
MPTFYDRFVECSQRWPDNVALEIQRHDHLESCTYAELRRMAESVGRWIMESGFPRGSRLAIVADNHPRWVAAYLGIIASGCAAVPLDTALHADQVTKLLKDSGASAVFVDAKHVPVTRPAAAELNLGLILMDPDRMTSQSIQEHWRANLPAIFREGPARFTPAASNSYDLAALIYTSGTTADPKGVMLTHANFLGEVEAVFNWVDIGPPDTLLGVLPMFHVLAQMANLLLPLVKGSRVVYLETLNTTELMRALSERSITAFAVVPQFFYLIHERIFEEIAKRGPLTQRVFAALVAFNRTLRRVGMNAGPVLFRKIHKTLGPKMRYLVTGGSRFDPAIAREFHDLGIDVLQAYGLTETAAAVFANPPNDIVIGSVGQALKGVEARILDPQPQEDGGPAVGEVLLRGPVVMKGYWNRPDATAAALRDGWLYTGDLGYFDARGNLFLTGRKKEVIVLSNGKNIYPEEIEAHYGKSQFVKEIAVVGLEGKPGEGGDRLHAVIVPNFDVLRQKKIVNAKEVIRYDIEGLSQRIASTKRIGSYEIWQEDLPRTTTRKIKRYEIEKRVRANQARKVADDSELPAEKPLTADELAWLDQSDIQRGLAIVCTALHSAPPNLRPTHNLELDLGLDSMQRVELLSRLEEELGGNVEESQLAEIYTVRDLLDAVLASAASGDTPATRTAVAGWKAILAEDPTDPEVLALKDPAPGFETVLYPLSRVIQMISRDLFHLRVSGLERLPRHGPFILSSNHQSYIDPLVLTGMLPKEIMENVFAVGTSDIFGQGLMRRVAPWLRVIVLNPDANLVPAMRAGAFGLKHGRVLILYPEGERSIDGTPRIFKKGAAILSIHMQAPIVPIAIEGFYEAWPRGKKFFQKITSLRMVFGEPICPPPEAEASEAAYEKLTAELRGRIVEMWERLRAV